MSNALFRAGRVHDFLPLVDFTHMVTDPEVVVGLYGRLLHFMIKNVANRPGFTPSGDGDKTGRSCCT
jgi:hypothetical protein